MISISADILPKARLLALTVGFAFLPASKKSQKPTQIGEQIKALDTGRFNQICSNSIDLLKADP